MADVEVAAQLADVEVAAHIADVEGDTLAGAGETGTAHLKSIKKLTGWNAFFRSVAPSVMAELGNGTRVNGQVSTVVSRMWRKLPVDRRKDWEAKAQRQREDMDTGLAEPRRCPTCNIQFSREKDLKYHQKGCHPCVCDECKNTFNHELKLKRHIAKTHGESFKCPVCKKTFAEKRNLKRHQKLHNNAPSPSSDS
ncbi:uncharacterized protein LOC144907043 [Branchiostoma floridae x Branchiostoma belcheri]|nr:hypothetical protein Bbelb_365100 [Branchiostoma belcheri]